MLRRLLCCTCVMFAALIPPSHASLIAFDFSGTASPQILQSGFMQEFGVSNPDWIGKRVSGTITMDIDATSITYYAPGFIQFGATQQHPGATWLNVTVNNPDGSTVTIPGAQLPNPFPTAEGEDAYALLSNNSMYGDGFYVQRTRNNSVSYPQQWFLFDLRSVSAQGLGLTDSTDYANVNINPAAADWNNYGVVHSYTSAGEGFDYSFTIEAVTGRALAVPEPASLSLELIGLLALAWVLRTRADGNGRNLSS